MKIRYVDFSPTVASVAVVGILAALAKCAISPLSLYAVFGIITILLATILGLKYVGSVSELTGVRPAKLNLHFCAVLLVSALAVAITCGGN